MATQVEGGGGFSSTVDADSLIRAAQFFPKTHAKEVRKALRNVGIKWTQRVTDRFGKPGGLKSRTGTLVGTIGHKVHGSTLKDLSLAFRAGGSRAPYARAQEHGAKIRPRKSNGFLTVPMPDALTAGGDLSGKAMIRRVGGDFVTDYGPTFIFTSDDGRKYIVVQDGDELRFLYSLRKSVTIPGPESDGTRSRLGATDTMKRGGAMTKFVHKQMQEAARRSLK